MIRHNLTSGLGAAIVVFIVAVPIVVVAVVGWGVWAFISDENITTDIIVADTNNCLLCHGNPEQIEFGYVAEESMKASAHGVFDCVICHSSEMSFPHEDTAVQLTLTEKCSGCHITEGEQYLTSIHGEQLVVGNLDVPTCVGCHSPDESPHSVKSIVSVAAYSAADYKKSIAETCAKCHADEELMGDYGISADVYDTYYDSFHGTVMRLASKGQVSIKDYATCTDCHGAHDILAVSDPVSPVAGLVNLTMTCEKCHTGAGVEFASSFAGHEEASPDNLPVAYYTEIFFQILLVGTLSFGGFVVIIAFIRFSMNRWREEE